jgi:short-subunit dehydrogenase
MPRRKTFRDARCLVTGASSGLGRAIASALLRQGASVVATARSAERLDAFAREHAAAGIPPERLRTVPADLTEPEDRRRLLEAASARFAGALDVVVNAAGVGAYGRFESHDAWVLRRVLEINFFALAELCRGALPLLRRGDRPSLVNVGSIVARRGLPGRPEYSASKFAVAGLTESLRAEWAIDGIHVLLINPAFTATAFEENLVVDTAVYKVQHRRTMTAEAVAEATLRALRRGRNEVTLTPYGRLLLLTNRLLPRFVDWGLGRWTRKLYSREDALRHAEAPPGDRSGEVGRLTIDRPAPRPDTRS